MRKTKIPLVFLCLVLLLGSCLADGAWFSDYYEHMHEPEQKAAIVWDGEKETMILSAAVRADDLANFAWVVPIQSLEKPEINEGDIKVFSLLVSFFAPSAWGLERTLALPGYSGIQVIESKEIGVYDVTVLRADRADNLLNWLNENGYKIPDDPHTTEVLDYYVQQPSFYFVANKVDLTNEFEKSLAFFDLLQWGGFGQEWGDSAQAQPKATARQMKPVLQFIIEHFWLTEGKVEKRFPDYELDRTAFEILVAEVSDRFAYPEVLCPFEKRTGLQERFGWKENTSLALVRDFDLSPFRNDGPVYCYDNTGRNMVEELLLEGEGQKTYLGGCPPLLREGGFDDIDELKAFVQKNLPKLRENFKKIRAEISADMDKKMALEIKPELLEEIKELNKTIQGLEDGFATPLKFEFKPVKPFYPLFISSLGAGQTKIEVYVLAETGVKDQSGILKVDQTKAIMPSLKKDLSEYLDLGQARYVTRLVYEGDLETLPADAFFVEGESPGFSLFELILDFISQLFR